MSGWVFVRHAQGDRMAPTMALLHDNTVELQPLMKWSAIFGWSKLIRALNLDMWDCLALSDETQRLQCILERTFAE